MAANPLDPDPARRHAAMRELRAVGAVVPLAGVDGVRAAVRYVAVEAGLRKVEDFGGSAAQDGLPEADQNIAAILEPRHGQIRRIINSVVAFHKSQQIEPYLQQLTTTLLDGRFVTRKSWPVAVKARRPSRAWKLRS